VVALDELVSRRRPGYSLPAELYLSPEVYRLDLERFVLRHWHCAGHISQIPVAGDWLELALDIESVIVVRGDDGETRAFANVCRHRGSRICEGASGHVKGNRFVCPYHAWVYRTDGSLAQARMMPEDFDLAGHGLRALPVRVVDGLIFVSLTEDPLGLDQVEEMLHGTIGPLGWADAQVVHTETYPIAANWKLALENQVECYHCAPSHPEFFKVHSQGRADIAAARLDVLERATAQGIDIACRDQWALAAVPGQEADYCNRFAMWAGAATASEDGRLVAPLMGFTQPDGGFTIFYVGPFNHFLAYSDYGAIFRYAPRSVDRTDLVVTWLVRGDAVEGTDFDPDRLTWLWRVTAAADRRIVEANQHGVASRFYEPGPYVMPIESSTNRLIEWYLHELTAPDPPNRLARPLVRR
jgi:phenylpropionate dioxygenase-like ring-hydroxylating dioxygenase large terminal subunit